MEQWAFCCGRGSFDYDIKALRKAYTMANIVPQAVKLGYINSISRMKSD